MIRFRVLCLLLLAFPGRAVGDIAVADTLFPKVHFDQWTPGKNQTPFKWNVRPQAVTLSNHQRWVSQIDVEIDGEEMESRRGKGALFVMFQVEDSAGRLYQDHGFLDLSKVQTGVKSQLIIYSESIFVLPGTYPMLVAIFDTNTSQHWLRRETLKVPAVKNDVLPFASRDLPPIEFVPQDESPDSWYLPTIGSRLHLPLDNRHPLKVDILVNITPSERVTGSQRIQDRNLGVLLSTMKALTSMDLKSGSLNVEAVDLQRQKIAFRQEAIQSNAARVLDWSKMRAALTGDQLGTIDVKSLGDREHSAQFFVGEVGKRVRAADVLIILSSSVRFEQGIDLEPMHAEGTPDCRVFYIRYHPPPLRMITQPQSTPVFLSRRAPIQRGPVTTIIPPVVDQLEPMLKSLRHRLYDVQNPEEMRKALADLLGELSAI